MQSRLRRNRIYSLITRFGDKIVNFYVMHGPVKLRKKLNIRNDNVWEIMIDYIGISHGAMQNFVKNNVGDFKELIYQGKAGEIRTMLSLDKPKYNATWEEILDLLLEEISIENFTYNTYEHSLNMFSNIYNKGRTHRKLKQVPIDLHEVK
jgi:hypothetical protein